MQHNLLAQAACHGRCRLLLPCRPLHTGSNQWFQVACCSTSAGNGSRKRKQAEVEKWQPWASSSTSSSNPSAAATTEPSQRASSASAHKHNKQPPAAVPPQQGSAAAAPRLAGTAKGQPDAARPTAGGTAAVAPSSQASRVNASSVPGSSPQQAHGTPPPPSSLPNSSSSRPGVNPPLPQPAPGAGSLPLQQQQQQQQQQQRVQQLTGPAPGQAAMHNPQQPAAGRSRQPSSAADPARAPSKQQWKRQSTSSQGPAPQMAPFPGAPSPSLPQGQPASRRRTEGQHALPAGAPTNQQPPSVAPGNHHQGQQQQQQQQQMPPVAQRGQQQPQWNQQQPAPQQWQQQQQQSFEQQQKQSFQQPQHQHQQQQPQRPQPAQWQQQPQRQQQPPPQQQQAGHPSQAPACLPPGAAAPFSPGSGNGRVVVGSRRSSSGDAPARLPPRPVDAAAARALAARQLAAQHTFDYSRHKGELTLPEKKEVLLQKLEDQWGFVPVDLPEEGQSYNCTCPMCGNGRHSSRSFSVCVEDDFIVWNCFRANCGFKGGVTARGGPGASLLPSQEEMAIVQGGSAKAEEQLRSASEGGGSWETRLQQVESTVPTPVDTSSLMPGPLPAATLEWFRRRGISAATLERAGVSWAKRWDYDTKELVDVVAFPFTRDGVVVNVKFRVPDTKRFSQTPNGERVFYGYDEAKGSDTVIIVEGEMDKLSLNELGCWNVVSVPSGSSRALPSLGPVPPPQLDRQFRYLHNCWDLLEQANRVILATDNDGPGVALAEELARRVGKEKCWSVAWPTCQQDHPLTSSSGSVSSADDGAAGSDVSSNGAAAAAAGEAAPAPADAGEVAVPVSVLGADPAWYRKDANDVLVKDGPDVLRAFIEAAQPLPVQGLHTFEEFWKPLLDTYHAGFQAASGMSTGWSSLDECYRVVPGELTIVTGFPNSGKSEWLDALAVNLMQRYNWSIAYCSLENPPDRHAIKLMEKFVGKPFESEGYAVGVPRMSEGELRDALARVDHHFHLIRPLEDEMPSIEHVLQKAELAVLRYGIRGLIIDPYNELDHRRRHNVKETDHVSQMLSRIKRFAQRHDCHVWLVAHPRALADYSGSPPTLYDISGSAHFVNKADAAVVVHRPNSAMAVGRRGAEALDTPLGAADAVQVLVRKMRNKAAGKIGDAWLAYDRVTGRYEAVEVQEEGYDEQLASYN